MSVQNVVPGFGIAVDATYINQPVVGLSVTGDKAQYDIPYLGTAYVDAITAGSLDTASGFAYNPTSATLFTTNFGATSLSTTNASISTLGAREGTISSLTTSYINAIGTVGVGGSISTANASISTLGARTGTISTFTTAYMNAIGTAGAPGTISTANASISSLNCSNQTTAIGTISTFTSAYVNALGTAITGGSISTANASISTLGVRTGTISTLTASYINALGNAGVGGAISTTQATISSLNVSSINGAPAQPKYYFVNSNAVVGSVNPGSTASYNVSFINQSIPTVSGQKYQLIGVANVNSITATNDNLFAQLFVNGTNVGVSSVKTNSGINHNQQITVTYQGTYNFTGANTHALGIATSGTTTNYSIPQAQFTIITPIP